MDHTYDGYFKIDERSDGYYLQVAKPQLNGEPVKLKEVEEYLRAEHIENYDKSAIKEALNSADVNYIVKIADKYIDNKTVDEKLYRIEISDDRMRAYITFFESLTNNEKQKKVDASELERELRSRNVLYGINMDVLNTIANEHVANEDYLVAQGDKPIDPIPGRVEFKFKTTSDFKPEIDDQGNVNFKKISVINNVNEGDLLAELIQTVAGKPGRNLSDIEIAPKKGKLVRIKYGKNTRPNEDKTKLYADKSGLVKIFEEKIVVNNVYEVPNHIGNSTGNIEFDGSVVVHGNIITGFSVIAKGDIEVMGVVEGATVIAGGDIVLHSGIQGMGKSHIEAGGDLQTKFIEQANVSCKGNIHSEAILHSEVSCKGEIIVEGRKGMISGGVVKAGVSVSTKTIGSHMGTATEIEVGIEPELLNEYNDLRRDLPKMIGEADKLEKVILLLNKRKELIGELEAEKVEMYKSAVRNKVFLANKISVSQKRIEELQEEVDNRNTGFVKVSGTMYPGVMIGIGNVFYHVKEEVKYVKLLKDGADVKLTSL